MPKGKDDPLAANKPADDAVKRIRAEYQQSKKGRRRAKHAYVVAKHRARKLKHKLQRAIDRRESQQAGHNENKIRDKIVDNAFWGVKNESAIHYSQIRPIPPALVTPLYTDCSGFSTLCCKEAGAEDPNGLNYNGSGFTGTQYNHCPKVSISDLKVGDLLEHGGYPGSHVNVVVDVGSRTTSTVMVVSHGQESGPRQYTAAVEIAAHAGQPYYWLKTV